MKTNLLLLIVIICCLSSCKNESSRESKIGLILKGNHSIRKMNETNESNKSTNSSFFIFGSIKEKSFSGPVVSFAWELNDSTYILSTLSLNKIRIVFNEKNIVPSIKFRWNTSRSGYSCDNMEKIMSENIIYAVISIRKEDWPQEIHLPMNLLK